MNKHCRIYLFAAIAVSLILGAKPAPASGDLAAVADNARDCGVFSGSVDQVRSSVLGNGLREADGVLLLKPLLAACEKGLPMAPFEDKLAEGLAKHVPPPSIARALNKMLGEYGYALELLGGPSAEMSPAMLVVMGEGLFKGVPRDVFKDYMASFGREPADPLLNGAEMTSLLSQAGFDYSLVKPMLEAGFKANGLSPEWRYFIRIVLIARQRGLSDSSIADAAQGVLAEKGSLTDVSARLGFTSRDLTGRNISN